MKQSNHLIQAPIIDKIDKDELQSELNQHVFIKPTNKGDNEIYDTNAILSPNVMQEIGRLREITFREAGGGTGKSIDIDKYDLGKNAYRQLIVWNPKEKEIVGGYRYKLCGDSSNTNNIDELATAPYFDFSSEFKLNYLPTTIELGRSFIQPRYQKSIYALDNIWDGLGSLILNNPTYNYFFGKVTMYPSYNSTAKKLLLGFIEKHFGDRNGLLNPKKDFLVDSEFSTEKYNQIFTENTFKENYKILKSKIKENNESIPPLVNSYMRLTESMISFGTIKNKTFGEVEETAILMPIRQMNKEKITRHIY